MITMAVGSSQPVTEMSTRRVPGVKCGWHVSLAAQCNLCAICLENVGPLTSDNPVGLHILLGV
jgi:hypothetical protein